VREERTEDDMREAEREADAEVGAKEEEGGHCGCLRAWALEARVEVARRVCGRNRDDDEDEADDDEDRSIALVSILVFEQ
jgi:hypothetical protein